MRTVHLFKWPFWEKVTYLQYQCIFFFFNSCRSPPLQMETMIFWHDFIIHEHFRYTYNICHLYVFCALIRVFLFHLSFRTACSEWFNICNIKWRLRSIVLMLWQLPIINIDFYFNLVLSHKLYREELHLLNINSV